MEYFGAERFRHTVGDDRLREKGLFPLESYLMTWASMLSSALENIPEERLFICRIDELTSISDKLAEFLGVRLFQDHRRP